MKVRVCELMIPWGPEKVEEGGNKKEKQTQKLDQQRGRNYKVSGR
jgi:hypothetical protein